MMVIPVCLALSTATGVGSGASDGGSAFPRLPFLGLQSLLESGDALAKLLNLSFEGEFLRRT